MSCSGYGTVVLGIIVSPEKLFRNVGVERRCRGGHVRPEGVNGEYCSVCGYKYEKNELTEPTDELKALAKYLILDSTDEVFAAGYDYEELRGEVRIHDVAANNLWCGKGQEPMALGVLLLEANTYSDEDRKRVALVNWNALETARARLESAAKALGMVPSLNRVSIFLQAGHG